MTKRIKALAPATISNINCGFDVLGAALDVVCDEVIAESIPTPGVEIVLVGELARQTPADPHVNTAGKAVFSFLRDHGLENAEGIRLRIKKHITPGSGLGASAASACAAVVLANKIYRTECTKRELLNYALDGERSADGSIHADNVAPCLIGGITLVRDAESADIHRIYSPEGLYVTIALPELQIMTSEARGILRKEVPFDLMIRQSANLAAFVHALHTGDLELLHRTQEDLVVEPQRKHLITGFESVKDAALTTGAIGAGISGAGPSMYALSTEKGVANEVKEAMVNAFARAEVLSTGYVSEINHEGVVLC